jgi:plastocyanin
MAARAALACTLAIAVGDAQSALIEIDPWTITDYEDMDAAVGDAINFKYASFHNVYLHPSGSCDRSDSMLVGGDGEGGGEGASYTFTGPGRYTFACQVGSHCDAGQILTVNVAAAGGDSREGRVGARCAVGGHGDGVGGPGGSGSGTGGGISGGGGRRRDWCRSNECPECDQGLVCQSDELNGVGLCLSPMCFGTCQAPPAEPVGGCADGEVQVGCMVRRGPGRKTAPRG